MAKITTPPFVPKLAQKKSTSCGGVRYPIALRKTPTHYVASAIGQEPRWNAGAADVPNAPASKCTDDAPNAIDSTPQSKPHHAV